MSKTIEFTGCRAAATFFAAATLTLTLALTLTCLGQAQAQEDDTTVEKELGVHRLETETTSAYDAFAYLNRLPTEFRKGETAVQFAGAVLYSRLANQEGRIEVKLVEGLNRSGYYGYKSFLRSWPEEGAGSGSCVVCHRPPTFASEAKYVVDESGEAKAAPTLRNLEDSGKDLEAIIQAKVKMAEMVRAGSVEGIDEAYKNIELSESDVEDIVQFLGSLNETPKEGFRDLILSATILDTTDVFN